MYVEITKRLKCGECGSTRCETVFNGRTFIRCKKCGHEKDITPFHEENEMTPHEGWVLKENEFKIF